MDECQASRLSLRSLLFPDYVVQYGTVLSHFPNFRQRKEKLCLLIHRTECPLPN